MPVPAAPWGFCLRCAPRGAGVLGGHRGVYPAGARLRSLRTGATFLVVILLLFVGNVLLGVAVWRSGTLPRWAGAIWVASALLLYPLGLAVAMTITGSTPPTALVGAMLVVISGGWIAWSVMRQPSSQVVGAEAQPRVR